METQLISSQRFLDMDIVDSKKKAGDFFVYTSPEFTVMGKKVSVVIDGHHSLTAAQEMGITPTYIVLDSTQHDAICILDRGDVDGFLEVIQQDDDYYYISTSLPVF